MPEGTLLETQNTLHQNFSFLTYILTQGSFYNAMIKITAQCRNRYGLLDLTEKSS